VYLRQDAERQRRVLACIGLLGAVTLQAWWPHAELRSVSAWALKPTSALFVGMTSWLVGPALQAAEPRPSNVDFTDLERDLGTPLPVPGVAWLDLPRIVDEEGRTLLKGGNLLGAEIGQPVVFGDRWLGRVAAGNLGGEVSVHGWEQTDVRTGIWLDAEDEGAPLRGVCIGRGGDLPPLVMFLESRCEPVAGSTVFWRARHDDFPQVEDARFRLGRLDRAGDESRGEGHWVVEKEMELGVQGRVFVAAGAIFGAPRYEVRLRREPVQPALRLDAVLGSSLRAVQTDSTVEFDVVVAGGRVLGAVVAQAGSVQWIALWPFERWKERGLAWNGSLLEMGNHAGSGDSIFTSGADGFPRGLFVGVEGEQDRAPSGQWQGVGR